MPLKIVRNNIINMEADAIVNTANYLPIVGSGVDSTIYEAAGFRQLLDERQKIGEIPYGEVAVTPAFNLKAKYILHAVTPFWRGGGNGEIELLRSCYENIMRLALQFNCESVAIPLLATGNNAYPKGLSLRMATEVITSYLDKYDIMVYLVVYDKASFTVAGKLFADIESMLDESDFEADYFDEECFENFIANDYKAKRCLLYECNDKICYSLTCDECVVEKKSLLSTALKDASKKKMSGAELDRELARLLANKEAKTFSEKLFQLIEEKGMEDVDVYKNANLDRKLFSKLRRKNYKPSKNTVLALAFSLELTLEETEELLKYAGLALAPNKRFDLIVKFCLKNNVHNIYDVNAALFKYTDETLN